MMDPTACHFSCNIFSSYWAGYVQRPEGATNPLTFIMSTRLMIVSAIENTSRVNFLRTCHEDLDSIRFEKFHWNVIVVGTSAGGAANVVGSCAQFLQRDVTAGQPEWLQSSWSVQGVPGSHCGGTCHEHWTGAQPVRCKWCKLITELQITACGAEI